MANDASEPAQTIAIKKALEEVGTAANEFYKLSARQPEENDPAVGGGELTVANTVLFAKTMNLLRAVRGPVDMLLAHFQNVSILRMFHVAFFANISSVWMCPTITSYLLAVFWPAVRFNISFRRLN